MSERKLIQSGYTFYVFSDMPAVLVPSEWFGHVHAGPSKLSKVALHESRILQPRFPDSVANANNTSRSIAARQFLLILNHLFRLLAGSHSPMDSSRGLTLRSPELAPHTTVTDLNRYGYE